MEPRFGAKFGPRGLLEALAGFAMKAVDGLFDTLKQPLGGIIGVGEQVAVALILIIEAIQVAGIHIAKNDFTPIRLAAEQVEQVFMRLITPVVELVQAVIGGINRFLGEAWKKVGAQILEWIKEYAAEQCRRIKEIADLIQHAGKWLWEKTSGLREPCLQNILELGDSPEGKNGILEWVELLRTGTRLSSGFSLTPSS